MKCGFENNSSMSQEELKRLVQSPEAQKLMAMLSQDGGATLRQASAAAQSGQYDAAMQLLAPKLQTAQADELLRKLEQKG